MLVLLVSPTVGTIARVLVHESLAILATDLGDLLGRHLLLWRHTIPRHRLSIPGTHRHPIARIRIITRIVSGRTIALLHRVSSRHIPRHRLGHAAARHESNLRMTSHVRPALDLDHSLETILNRPSSFCWATGRHSDAERECLGWTTPKIVGPGDLDVSREENVLPALMLLNPRIVDGDPYELCIIFEHSRDVQVTGPNDFGSGPTQTFPFSVGMPSCRPTKAGGSIENSLKAVVQVKGRPDMTGHTQVAFMPGSSMPQPMPGYMPGGYPVQQGYGPPGYNPGYNPNPGYGMPMGPGYGQPMPGYGMPPQQQMPPQQVAQVRCKYCQALMNQNSSNCPNCGAHQ